MTNLRAHIRDSLLHRLKLGFSKAATFESTSNTVLIVRTDAIGDYILFRNFLEILRGAKPYTDKRLVLVGNELWRDLAETYDKDFVDSFVWLNPKRFYISNSYKWEIIKQLRQFKATEIIISQHSRSFLTDDLVAFSGAAKRLAPEGDDVSLRQSFYEKNKALYTQFLPSLPPTEFEFFRNRYFFEQILGKKIGLTKPFLPIVKPVGGASEKRFALFIGANAAFRQWSAQRFADLMGLIGSEMGVRIFTILGGEKEAELGKQIVQLAPKHVVVNNHCGKTTLVELANHIAAADYLISNESSAVHFAAAIGTPTVCISNGNHFGRFCPYPLSINSKITTVFPSDSFYQPENFEALVKTYVYGSDLDINGITAERVFTFLKNNYE
jgi:ADP-heptose:LPS heptosyltransferase